MVSQVSDEQTSYAIHCICQLNARASSYKFFSPLNCNKEYEKRFLINIISSLIAQNSIKIFFVCLASYENKNLVCTFNIAVYLIVTCFCTCSSGGIPALYNYEILVNKLLSYLYVLSSLLGKLVTNCFALLSLSSLY